MTREEWLNKAADKIRPFFLPDYKVQECKISIGFPPKGGLSKHRVMGICWKAEATTDKIAQIYINPTIAESQGPQGILSVLSHEMVHACGINGHGKQFTKCARHIGLEGKMSSSIAGPDLLRKYEAIEEQIGKCPHAPLVPGINLSGQKQDKCRMFKCSCEECGYTVRVAAKWIELAMPICPICNKELTKEIK